MEAGVIQRATGSGAPRRRPSAAKTWLKAIELTSRIEAEPHRLFADVVEEWAQRQPGRPALLSDGQSFTYGELAARINRYARWALGLGIRTGRTVCLLMPNRPDYLACWLGISRVGGTVALINTRLVGRSLAHCIDVARADHVILAAECVDAFETARPHLDRVPQIWSLGAGGAGADLDAALAAVDTRPLSSAERGNVTIDATRAPHLHLGHHGAAEGGERQSSPHSQLGWMVCRAHGRFRGRPALRLPAAPSFRGRRRRALQHAARGRFGRDRGEVLRRRTSGTTSCVSTAPSSNISASSAATC